MAKTVRQILRNTQGKLFQEVLQFVGQVADSYNYTMVLRNEGTIKYIDVLKESNFKDDRPLEKNVSNFVYDLSKVSGDFDNDGYRYDFDFLTLTGYNPDKVTSRVVASEFDRDGNQTDLTWLILVLLGGVLTVTTCLTSQEKTVELDLSSQPAEVYLLNINSSTVSKQIKLIKK